MHPLEVLGKKFVSLFLFSQLLEVTSIPCLTAPFFHLQRQQYNTFLSQLKKKKKKESIILEYHSYYVGIILNYISISPNLYFITGAYRTNTFQYIAQGLEEFK